MPSSPVTILDAQRVASWKTPYSTRRVPREAFATLLTGAATPRVGDLVLVRVDRLGQHKHLELAGGRRARLFVGDEIVLAYGHRYAPDQFEAEVPDDVGPCHMVAAGGVAARVLTKHDRMGAPTRITPLGLLGDSTGRALNLSQFALARQILPLHQPFTVAVVGTSMNAGKTETATHIIRGLKRAGYRVGAAKVTGTGAGGDAWSMRDAGAFQVLDFGDVGLPSTYLASPQRVEEAMCTLISQLTAEGAQAIVFEVADGVFQRETAALVKSSTFKRAVDAVVFAAGDAMGSVGGVAWLREHRLPVVAAGGVLTASPLASREAAQQIGLPLMTLDDLASPAIAQTLTGAPMPVAAPAAEAELMLAAE
jgi:hypothetical protein